jgi:hypothetical protein
MNGTHAPAGDARPTSRGPADNPGPTYYLDRQIRVTQRRLYVENSELVVAELDNVGTDRETCPASGVVAGALAAVSVIVLAAAVASGATMLAMVAGVAVVAGTPMAVLTWRGRPYQLWATYHGVDVRLYRCHDQVQFGKVTRAIMRAWRSGG